MKRTISRINLGEDQIRVIVKIEGEECPNDTLDSFRELISMMKTFTETPHLLQGESFAPSEVKWYHNGTRWVVESQAITTKVANVQANSADSPSSATRRSESREGTT